MPTPRQVTANRLNSLKSTGPSTPAGMSISRRNALKHGLRSFDPALLPGESKATWESFSKAILDDLDPATFVPAMDQTVRATRSRLRRARRETTRYRQTAAASIDSLDPAAKFDRYESSLQRNLSH